MTLLEERELTAEERAAIADEPRPGVWIEEHLILPAKDGKDAVVQRLGDGRALDQAQTDSAIAAALFRNAPRDESNDVLGVVVSSLSGSTRVDGKQYATDQRGGIHSDPLVRLLAFRAWGDRDRRWTRRDTAKAASVGDSTDFERWRMIYEFDGLVMYDQPDRRCELYGAQRGAARAEVAISYGKLIADDRGRGEILLDVFDELDAKLAAGGDPPTAGPTFEISSPPRS